jgi:hypothetical protein
MPFSIAVASNMLRHESAGAQLKRAEMISTLARSGHERIQQPVERGAGKDALA